MERYLIINADDYGMSLSANEAVEHLFNEGFITSTTLMTPCPWAEDAIYRAKHNKRMRVGLHLTFNAEYDRYKWGPVTRDKPVRSLLDDNGYFFKEVKPLLDKAEPEDIRAEMEAQYFFMVKQGLEPTHADNHMGSLYGLYGRSFIKETFEFLSRHGLNFRLPRSLDGFGRVPDDIAGQLSHITATADNMGIGLPDHIYTHPNALTPQDTYETLRDYYLNLIRNARPGITELFLHPAKETDELKAICPEWQKRVWEYRLMLDDIVIKTIEAEGIKLVGWTDAPFGKSTK